MIKTKKINEIDTKIKSKSKDMRVSMGLTDRRKTAKNLADSRKN